MITADRQVLKNLKRLKWNLRMSKISSLVPAPVIPTVPVQVPHLSPMKLVDGNLLSNPQCLSNQQLPLPNTSKEDSLTMLMRTNTIVLLMPDFSFNKKSPQEQEKPESIPLLLKKLTEKLLFTCSMTTLTGDLTTSVDTFSHKRERFTGTTRSRSSDPKLKTPMRLWSPSLPANLTPK